MSVTILRGRESKDEIPTIKHIGEVTAHEGIADQRKQRAIFRDLSRGTG